MSSVTTCAASVARVAGVDTVLVVKRYLNGLWFSGAGRYLFLHGEPVGAAAGYALLRHVHALREAVRVTRRERPFHIDAWVVLPTTCIASGPCHREMTISPIAGRRSRPVMSLSNDTLRAGASPHRARVRRMRGEW